MKYLILLIFLLFSGGAAMAEESVEEVEEMHCMALNLYYEGRGEMDAGKLAIGLVTLERVERSEWPDSVCGVVKQARVDANGQPIRHKCAFSWYCDGKSDEPTDEDAWLNSVAMAELLLHGGAQDFMQGATHYHNTTVNPRWARAFKKIGHIGEHIFYVQED